MRALRANLGAATCRRPSSRMTVRPLGLPAAGDRLAGVEPLAPLLGQGRLRRAGSRRCVRPARGFHAAVRLAVPTLVSLTAHGTPPRAIASPDRNLAVLLPGRFRHDG